MKKLLPSFSFKLSSEGTYLEIANLYLAFFTALQMDQRVQEINEIILKKLFNRIPFLCKMIKIIIFMSRNSFQSQIKLLFLKIDQFIQQISRKTPIFPEYSRTEETLPLEKSRRKSQIATEGRLRRIEERKRDIGETREERDLGGGLVIFRKVIIGRNKELLKSDGFRGRKRDDVTVSFKNENVDGKAGEKNYLSEGHLVISMCFLKKFN
jgi:hypothetical protein